MITNNSITIPIGEERNRFNDFLKLEDNSKIIFSGIFGIGKTYFIEQYFSNNQEYEMIYLQPVNYSIVNNNDILKTIKVDIFYELLGNAKDYWG